MQDMASIACAIARQLVQQESRVESLRTYDSLLKTGILSQQRFAALCRSNACKGFYATADHFFACHCLCILWCGTHWQLVFIILIQDLVTITMIDLGISHYLYWPRFEQFHSLISSFVL